MEKSSIAKWYEELISSINQLSEQFGLDENSATHLREFIIQIAREQYKIGNKSGARWAFKKIANESNLTA